MYTFDGLRHRVYTFKDKSHLLQCHYFVNLCLDIHDSSKEKLQPVNFGWKLLGYAYSRSKFVVNAIGAYYKMWL